MTRLKQEIARRTYRVDSEAVAREILFKLRVIQRGRRGLLGAGGHSATPPSGK